MPPTRQGDFQKGNLFEDKLGDRGPQNHFLTAVVKTAA